MKSIISILVCCVIATILILPTLSQTQIHLTDRGFVAGVQDDSNSIMNVEQFDVNILQTTDNVQIISVVNNAPEKVTLTINTGTPDFVNNIIVSPEVVYPGESCNIILDYDTTLTVPGKYNIPLVIEANGLNSYFLLYRDVEVIVSASFDVSGLGGKFSYPFKVGSSTLEANQQQIILTLKDGEQLSWTITGYQIQSALSPTRLEILNHFSDTEWYGLLVQEFGEPETWIIKTYTGQSSSHTLTVQIFNNKYVLSYSQSEEDFTSFFIGEL